MQKNNSNEKAEKKQITTRKSLALALEFGFIIAIPLLIFAFVGNKLAEHYSNKGFLFGGLTLALITSCIWLYRRINDIYNEFIQ